MDSPRTPRQALPRLKRYTLVQSRFETQGARIRRFRLMQAEALARLEPGARTPRPAR